MACPGEGSQRCGARRRRPLRKAAESPPERSEGHLAVVIFRKAEERFQSSVELGRAIRDSRDLIQPVDSCHPRITPLESTGGYCESRTSSPGPAGHFHFQAETDQQK